MSALHCLRGVARGTFTTTTTTLRPSISHATPIKNTRAISLLSPRRPLLPTSLTTLTSTQPSTLPTSTTAIPSATAADLASKISSHPALGSMQIRCGPRDTYNPSHFVRKRRHGFLSRIRTKKGRKTLMRRVKKGRWNLSH